MEITIDRKALVGALQVAASVASGSARSIPIMGCALVTAENGKIRVVATDLERFVSIPVAATCCASQPSVAIPIKPLLTFCKASKASEVQLWTDIPDAFKLLGHAVTNAAHLAFNAIADALRLKGRIEMLSDGHPDWINVKADKARTRLSTWDARSYPAIPKADTDAFRASNAVSSIRTAMLKTVHAVSADDARYNLAGICFEQYGCTATDGHRLSHFGDHGLKLPDASLIVPKTFVTLFLAATKGKGMAEQMVTVVAKAHAPAKYKGSKEVSSAITG